MLDLQRIAKALGGEISNGQVRAPGPDHSPKDRSLSVKIGDDGEIVVNSFAKDDAIKCKDYVRQKLGLGPFKPNGHRRPSENAVAVALAAAVNAPVSKPRGAVVCTYDYTDTNGALLYQNCRFEPKDFRQRRPNGNGGWVWKLEERRVLYRWPELLRYPDATVFLCEGEKDADRVASLGHCATTVASGKWTADCIQALSGRDVWILEDNDDAGRERANDAAQALNGVAKSIRIVRLPGLADKGDVSDWLDAGHSGSELEDVCYKTPLWEPSAASTHEVSSLGEWDAGDDTSLPPPREWLLGNIFARGFMSSLLAEGGTGKTALRYAQFLSLATGRSLTGEYVFQRCRVLIISLEDNADELRRRILAARLHFGIDAAELRGWLFLAAPGAAGGKLMTMDKKGQLVRGVLADKLEAVIVARKIDLVSLDPFVKTHSVEENSNSAIDDVVQILTDLGAMYNIAIDAPHHVSKGASDPGNASRGRGASAMKDAGRLVYTLATMTADEAKAFGVPEEQRRFLVRMDSAKVNIAPPMAKAKWFRLIGVQLGNGTGQYPNGDEVQTVEPWTPPEIWAGLDTPLLNQILDQIDGGLPDGCRYSDARSAKKRAAWQVVCRVAPTKSEAAAREIIKAWVKTGVLVSEEYHNETARKDEDGLRLDATKRPGQTSSY